MVGDFGWEHEGRKSRVGTVKSNQNCYKICSHLRSAVDCVVVSKGFLALSFE